MNRKMSLLLAVLVSALLLTACGKTIEERALQGIEQAEATFTSAPNETNKTIGKIELYLPNGFTIEPGIDEANYTVSHDEQSYLLFVNPNETENSQLHYELLKQDKEKKIIEEKTFEKEGVFGFSAVIAQGENSYELIVSVGGVKMTTLSDKKKLDVKLQNMMEIVQSAKTEN